MRELLPISLLGGVLGLDVVCFPQVMISRPIVLARAMSDPTSMPVGLPNPKRRAHSCMRERPRLPSR